MHPQDLAPFQRLGGRDTEVVRARTLDGARTVVCKRAPRERPDLVAALDREHAALQRARRLGGRTVVRPLGIGTTATHRVLLLADATGGDLAERLRTVGPLPASDALHLAADVADGLATLHTAGVLHRDVHPGNVLFDAELVGVLADLDHALVDGAPPLPRDTGVVGHPGTVDPRLFAGVAPDVHADLHGLGCTLWAAATGLLPEREGPAAPPHLPSAAAPAPVHEVVVALTTGEFATAAEAAVRCRTAAAMLRPVVPPLAPPLSDATLRHGATPIGALPPTPDPDPRLPTAPPHVDARPGATALGATRRYGPAPPAGESPLTAPLRRAAPFLTATAVLVLPVALLAAVAW